MLVPRAMVFEFIPVDESGEDQPTVCTPCNFSIAVKLLIFFFCLEIFIYLSLIMALVYKAHVEKIGYSFFVFQGHLFLRLVFALRFFVERRRFSFQ